MALNNKISEQQLTKSLGDDAVLICEQTMPIGRFMRILRLSDRRTLYGLAKKVNAKIIVNEKNVPVKIETLPIKEYMKINHLPKKFLTIAEAANVLDISEDKMLNFIRTGKVPYYKYCVEKGSNYLFIKRELLDMKERYRELSLTITADPRFYAMNYYLRYHDNFFAKIIKTIDCKNSPISPRTVSILKAKFIDKQRTETIRDQFGICNARVQQIVDEGLEQIVSLINIGIENHVSVSSYKKKTA